MKIFDLLNQVRKAKVESTGAKFVLLVLATYADADGGSCFPSQESIASDTGQDVRTVRRHIKYLVENGFITKDVRYDRNGKTSNSYQLCLDSVEDKMPCTVEDKNDIGTGQNEQRYRTKYTSVEDTGVPLPTIDQPSTKPIDREKAESNDSLPTPKAIEPKQEALITQTVENTENNEGRSVPLDSDIVTVFDSWMRLHPGRQFKLNDKKRGHIRARLKTFSVSEIQEALHKLSQDAWHSERGKFDFEYCFRRDEQIEKFLSFRINGKSKPTTAADVRAMEAKYAVIKPLKSDEES